MRTRYKKLKFIADVNVEKPLIDFLISEGIDVEWVSDIDKRMTNSQLIGKAEKEKRILITNDKDFGQIVFLEKKISWGIILFRIKSQNSSKKIILLKKLLERYPDRLEKHFVVITKDKFRFIALKEVYE